jgi:hypothetical protein
MSTDPTQESFDQFLDKQIDNLTIEDKSNANIDTKLKPSPIEQHLISQTFKAQGNTQYSSQKYTEALSLYAEAINHAPYAAYLSQYQDYEHLLKKQQTPNKSANSQSSSSSSSASSPSIPTSKIQEVDHDEPPTKIDSNQNDKVSSSNNNSETVEESPLDPTLPPKFEESQPILSLYRYHLSLFHSNRSAAALALAQQFDANNPRSKSSTNDMFNMKQREPTPAEQHFNQCVEDSTWAILLS